MPHNQPLLCPKEVSELLGISERTAARLMSSGEIVSMRVGAKLLRTTQQAVSDYKVAQFALAQEGPEVRALMQSIACLRELDRLELLPEEQQYLLRKLETDLEERKARQTPLLRIA